MGKSVNQVVLIGRMTADVEVKSTTSGKSVASFTLAVDKIGKDQGANFFDITAWEKIAEILQQYTKKGSKVCVLGRLEQQTWTDKDSGTNRNKVVIIANDVTLLDSKAETTAQGATGANDTGDSPVNLDDIPF